MRAKKCIKFLAIPALVALVVFASAFAIAANPANNGTNDVKIELAPIHEVEVIILDTLPPQVGVYIKGGLRDGCTTLHDAVVTREGNTIHIEVTTQRPKDAICTQVYTYFEESLDLGSDFPAGTYTMKVNDYVTTFEIPCSL